MRVIGLDIGARRTGIAVSDEIGLTARPLETVETSHLRIRLAELLEEHGTDRVVVGRPRSLDGSLGGQAAATEAVVDELRQMVPAVYAYEDETGTTVASAADGRDDDAGAARVMLQGYLNERKS